MADYDCANLERETLLLIVTSTFGNGESPDNGEVIVHISSFYDPFYKVLLIQSFGKELRKMVSAMAPKNEENNNSHPNPKNVIAEEQIK